jgi:hypothetical protein
MNIKSEEVFRESYSAIFGNMDRETSRKLAEALMQDNNHTKLVSAIESRKWDFAANIVDQTIKNGYALALWMVHHYKNEKEIEKHLNPMLSFMVIKRGALELYDKQGEQAAKDFLNECKEIFSSVLLCDMTDYLPSWLDNRDKNFQKSLEFAQNAKITIEPPTQLKKPTTILIILKPADPKEKLGITPEKLNKQRN